MHPKPRSRVHHASQGAGEGAFGIVYEALDRVSGARVALKELMRLGPATIASFKQEFRAVQELDHPNLVRLEALFEELDDLQWADVESFRLTRAWARPLRRVPRL